MENYHIAGINLQVIWEEEFEKIKCYRYHECIALPRVLAAFRTDDISAVADMKVLIKKSEEFKKPASHKKIYNQSFYESSSNMTMVFDDPFYGDKAGCSIVMSKDYSYIEYIPHTEGYNHYDLQWMAYPFEGRVLYQGGIVLHGAAIEYDHKGIIFTGISGSGKSTQAHLWQKFREALIINGDCPCIRMMDNRPTVFGTPWCGSSGEAINRRVPLETVILVKQGEQNSIKELKGNMALYAMLSNVLHSNFDERSLDLAIENLQSFIGQIRVYELTCTVSQEAVRIVEDEIKLGL